MEETKLEIVYLPVENLKPYEKNARKHQAKDVESIKSSIKEFGMCDPIGIWSDKNIIVEGHGRLMALKELGYTEVPCIRLDHLSDEQRKAYALAHNRTAELSEWDQEILIDELLSLENSFDLNSFGFNDRDIQMMKDKKEAIDDNFDMDSAYENIEEPTSKLGDIYQLGNHRLMCGDSTNPEHIEKLMGADKATLLLTDPPYNVNYSANETRDRIMNDAFKENEDYVEFLSKAFTNGDTSLNPGGCYYIFLAGAYLYENLTATHNAGWNPKHILIWKKDSLVLGRSDYQYIHEPFLYGWKDGASHVWYNDRKQTSVFECPRPKASKLHPTMKPIELFCYLMNNSSKEGDVVLDLFGGSGTTLMCAEQLNRKARLMELDPKFVDVIVARWESFTGKKAVKL